MTWKDITSNEDGKLSVLDFVNRNGKELQIALVKYHNIDTYTAILIDNIKSQIVIAKDKKGTYEEAKAWCEKFAEKL